MSDLRKVSNNLSKMIGAEAGEIIGKLPEILNEEQQKAVVQDVNELVVRAFAGSDVEIKPLAASARVGALDRLTIAIARYDHSASKALLPIREAAKPEWRIADFLCGEEEKIDQALNWLINQRGTCEQNLVYLNLLLKHKYNPQYAKANLPMKIELAENTIRMQLFRQMGGYRLYRSSNDAQPLPPEVVLIQELAAFSIVSAPESLVSILWGYRAEPLQPAVPAKLPSSTPIRERKSMPMPMRDYIVRFLPSKRNLVKKQLEEAGATILQPLGGTDYPDYIVAIPSKEAMESIEDLPGKLWIEPYQPSIRLNLSRYQSPSNQPLETAESLTTERDEQKVIPHAFYASFFTPQDRDLAAAVWRTQGIEIVETVGKKDLIVSISGVVNPEQALDLLIRQVGLRYLEEELKVSLLGNVACRVIGVPPSSVGEASLNLTGKAEILAIADSGLDNGDINTLHPDFRGRVKAIQPYRPGLPVADESGHGTHVAGIAIGNGTQASSMNLTIKGVAPEAELFFQAGVTSVDHLPNPAHLFEAAYEQGARVHSNSWGVNLADSRFTSRCEQVDEFVWNHKDFLAVFAAGNSACQENHGEPLTQKNVSTPGVAKNCLTVGACENDRPDIQLTYGAWRKKFSHRPIERDGMTDSVDHLAPFSSRGPSLADHSLLEVQGRRKPDVVAPGTFVLSTKSSLVTEAPDPWHIFPDAPNHYVYDTGTSMATPLVAGAALLVRQYLREQRQIHNPSAALLKAALIHSARYFHYYHSHPDSTPPADNEQGWGRIYLPNILSPLAPIQILFIDEERQLDQEDFIEYLVEVGEGEPEFRATFVYTDLPDSGGVLMNNLNLAVTDPNGKIYYGNDFGSTGKFDEVNNVEGIVAESVLGQWRVKVIAQRIIEAQDFALVLSGSGLKLL